MVNDTNMIYHAALFEYDLNPFPWILLIIMSWFSLTVLALISTQAVSKFLTSKPGARRDPALIRTQQSLCWWIKLCTSMPLKTPNLYTTALPEFCFVLWILFIGLHCNSIKFMQLLPISVIGRPIRRRRPTSSRAGLDPPDELQEVLVNRRRTHPGPPSERPSRDSSTFGS